MVVLNLSNKTWKSLHHGCLFEYNPRIWTLVPSTYDEKNGMIFGVYDKNDGSSFVLDIDKIEEIGGFDFDCIADEYYSKLFNSDNSCKRLSKHRLSINNIEFHFEIYSFNNKIFGQQIVARGVHIGSENSIGIAVSWPDHNEVLPKYKVPPKFEMFLDKIEINNI